MVLTCSRGGLIFCPFDGWPAAVVTGVRGCIGGMTDPGLALAELRPLMFSVAYRMLGSVAEAEDVVQEACLRMHASAPGGLRSAGAYAVTVTARLAIDALRSARRRRQRYISSWLPEPLAGPDQADPAWRFEMDDTVSVAFLVLLEKLTPVERAVFLLREVFGYPYADIAAVAGKSEAACRQVLHRARQHLRDHRSRFAVPAAERERLAGRFFAAVRDGDLAGLEAVLSDDVVFYGDGGGQAPAIREPVRGPTQVARLVLGLARQARHLGILLEPVRVNGHPGAHPWHPTAQSRPCSHWTSAIAMSAPSTTRSTRLNSAISPPEHPVPALRPPPSARSGAVAVRTVKRPGDLPHRSPVRARICRPVGRSLLPYRTTPPRVGGQRGASRDGITLSDGEGLGERAPDPPYERQLLGQRLSSEACRSVRYERSPLGPAARIGLAHRGPCAAVWAG